MAERLDAEDAELVVLARAALVTASADDPGIAAVRELSAGGRGDPHRSGREAAMTPRTHG